MGLKAKKNIIAVVKQQSVKKQWKKIAIHAIKILLWKYKKKTKKYLRIFPLCNDTSEWLHKQIFFLCLCSLELLLFTNLRLATFAVCLHSKYGMELSLSVVSHAYCQNNKKHNSHNNANVTSILCCDYSYFRTTFIHEFICFKWQKIKQHRLWQYKNAIENEFDGKDDWIYLRIKRFYAHTISLGYWERESTNSQTLSITFRIQLPVHCWCLWIFVHQLDYYMCMLHVHSLFNFLNKMIEFLWV